MRTLYFQRLRHFLYISIAYKGFHLSNEVSKIFTNEVSQLMRDSEIRESVDPLRVLQRTREKKPKELVCLTLGVLLTEELEQRLQFFYSNVNNWM